MTLVFSIFKYITRLAFEDSANCVQCRQPDGLGLAIFQNRKIGHGYANLLGKLSHTHLALGQHYVDVNYYCHALAAYTVKSFSDFIAIASRSNR